MLHAFLIFYLSTPSNLVIALPLLTTCEIIRVSAMFLAIITLDSCCPTKWVFILYLMFWATSWLCLIVWRSLKYGGNEPFTKKCDNIFSIVNCRTFIPKFINSLVVKYAIFFAKFALTCCSYLLERCITWEITSKLGLSTRGVSSFWALNCLQVFACSWHLLTDSCFLFSVYQMLWGTLSSFFPFEMVWMLLEAQQPFPF